MTAHEYEFGLHELDIDTTDILVDLRKMERNLKTMSDFSREKGKAAAPCEAP